MRGNDFLDKMNLVDSDFVETADEKPMKKKRGWVTWGAMAACAALVIFAGVKMLPRQSSEGVTRLPMLTLTEDEADGMGYEGYMAHDASELVNANPWHEGVELNKLPVYKNPWLDNGQFAAAEMDFNAMREALLDIAGRLGLDAETLAITDDAPDADAQKQIIEKFESTGDTVPEGYFEPTRLIAEADGLKIEVDKTLTAEIFFEPAAELPEVYNFTHYASYEEISAVAEYLKDKYSALIGFKNPQISIYGGDYDSYGRQQYLLGFYEKGADNVEQMINYNFNNVTFFCDDDGRLFLARVSPTNLPQKVGDYPVIPPDEALKLLSDGKYITSVPYDLPGTEFVGKTELIYRIGPRDLYYMPYYRFYVEIPEAASDGMKTYGAYYVPAVSEEYISNMPKWDGSFN